MAATVLPSTTESTALPATNAVLKRKLADLEAEQQPNGIQSEKSPQPEPAQPPTATPEVKELLNNVLSILQRCA